MWQPCGTSATEEVRWVSRSNDRAQPDLLRLRIGAEKFFLPATCHLVEFIAFVGAQLESY